MTSSPGMLQVLAILQRIERRLEALEGSAPPEPWTPVLCTPAQARVLQAYDDLTRKHGRAPTIAEVGAVLYLSESAVGHHVQRLAEAGFMSKIGGRNRSWRLTSKAGPVLQGRAVG